MVVILKTIVVFFFLLMLQMFSTATMNLGSCDSAFKPLTTQILTIRKHQSPVVETSNIGRAGFGVLNSRAWQPLSGKMKNICSRLIKKKIKKARRSVLPHRMATQNGGGRRIEREHTVVGRGAERTVDIWGWYCWLSFSTITSLKNKSAWYKNRQ